MFINQLLVTSPYDVILKIMQVVLTVAMFNSILWALVSRLYSIYVNNSMNKLVPVFAKLVTAVKDGMATSEQIKSTLPHKRFGMFGRFLRNSISDISHKDVSAELYIADVSGYSEHLRKIIRSNKRWRQANSLRTLSYLRSKANQELFLSVIQTSEFTPSIFSASLGLALTKSYDSMEIVFDKIYETTRRNEDMLLLIISSFGEESAPHLDELLKKEKVKINEKFMIIEAIGIFRYKKAVPTLMDLLQKTDNVELKLHVLDALKLMGDSSVVEDLLAYLNHEEYHVRAKAALAVGILGKSKFINKIEPLLQDENWFVRRLAAEAILNTGTDGLSRLKELETSSDELSQSTARLILTDMKYNKLGLAISE